MTYIIRNRIIGEGAQGIIKTAYKETDPDTIYAVKIFPYGIIKSNLSIGFRNDGYGEIALNQVLIHPNIIQLMDFMIDDSNMYLIMELADANLFQYMEDNVLTIDQKIKYMSQIGSALQYLHNNQLVHCDLKLDNILIKNDNAILSDFGISKLFDTMTSSCHYVLYRAPEIIFDKIPIKGSAYNPFYKNGISFTEVADIWAYGIICLEILYEQRFFKALNILKYRDVPEEYRTPTGNNIPASLNQFYGEMVSAVRYIYYLAYFYDRGTYQNLTDLIIPKLQTDKEKELLFCISKLLDVNYDNRIKKFNEFLSFDIFPPYNNGFQKLSLPFNQYSQVFPKYNDIFNNLLQICVNNNTLPIILISTIDFDLYTISVFWLFSNIYDNEITLKYCEQLLDYKHSIQDIMKSIIDIIRDKNGKILCDTIYNYLPSALTTEISLILMTEYNQYYSLYPPELMALKIIKNINDDPLLPKTAENVYDRWKQPEPTYPIYLSKILRQL